MARVLLLMSAAMLFFGAAACAAAGPRTLPAVTTSVESTTPSPSGTEVTTTVVTTSTIATPTKTTAPTKTKNSTKTKAGQREAACREDENQCYEPGTNTRCQTGGCVNAARGLTQRDVLKERDNWLRAHPGWCPAGETGAVAPC
ncbi:hypothetical protein AB0N89_06900 [Amycolatopsis sp. NPDC089917]|uniref:hypothetical protein n=1 Tax=Amycolatopsis sp. NPDC089917 TaxID=3155187 RepID=UPI00344A4ED3